MNGQMKTFFVEYVAEHKNHHFIRGEKYEAFFPSDNRSGNVYGVTDRFGEVYGYPASWFEKIES